MEKLLSVRELAQVLGVCPTTVYRWLGQPGKLPKPLRFSKRCVRFRESDAHEFLEKLTYQSTDQDTAPQWGSADHNP